MEDTALNLAPLVDASNQPRRPSLKSKARSKCCFRTSMRLRTSCSRRPARERLPPPDGALVSTRLMPSQAAKIPSVPTRTQTQISALGYCRFTEAMTGVSSKASPMCLNLVNRIFKLMSIENVTLAFLKSLFYQGQFKRRQAALRWASPPQVGNCVIYTAFLDEWAATVERTPERFGEGMLVPLSSKPNRRHLR